MEGIVVELRRQFIREAKGSPLLFNDLARMESYISESYTGRSLIELLQNADDAGAERFIVSKLQGTTYLVANDGREFTEEDMRALCRSGTSTKRRGSGTIGFRGIGFKSVVNYAKQVHLRSGDIAATFSRKMTMQMVPGSESVPLIRIPHDYTGQAYDEAIAAFARSGYHTFFVFEARDDTISDEASAFDPGALLFLNSITHVEFRLGGDSIIHETLRSKASEGFEEVGIGSQGEGSSWLVTRQHEGDEGCSLAFSFDGTHACDAPRAESVFHSFMPTTDSVSAPMKVNGDFSTDPSRTKVVIDEVTRHTAKVCSDIATRLVGEVLSQRSDRFHVVSVLSKMKADPLRAIRGESANDVLYDDLRGALRDLFEERLGRGYELWLQPAGFADKDFDIVRERLGVSGLSRRWEDVAPGMRGLLAAVGFKELPLERCLEAMKDVELSEGTRAAVVEGVTRAARLGMSKSLRESVRKARLVTFESGVKPIESSDSGDKVSPMFEGRVLEAVATPGDYTAFASASGMSGEQLAMNERKPAAHTTAGVVRARPQTFTRMARPHKWRSVEQNVAEVLRGTTGVTLVEDVTLQNVGYDLRVVMNDGTKRYYEVKSVDGPGGTSFSFTTNEYSSAVSHGKDYYLAIAWQNAREISVCFVSDPAHTIDWQRRATRWDWVCTGYSGDTVTAKLS